MVRWVESNEADLKGECISLLKRYDIPHHLDAENAGAVSVRFSLQKIKRRLKNMVSA